MQNLNYTLVSAKVALETAIYVTLFVFAALVLSVASLFLMMWDWLRNPQYFSKHDGVPTWFAAGSASLAFVPLAIMMLNYGDYAGFVVAMMMGLIALGFGVYHAAIDMLGQEMVRQDQYGH